MGQEEETKQEEGKNNSKDSRLTASYHQKIKSRSI
jgi:hypothetical protein